MKIKTIHLTLLLALSLFCGNAVKADFMNWSYSTTPSVPGFSVGGGGSPGGTVQLTDFTNQAGGKSIPVIAVVTSSASASPVAFDSSNTAYSMKMTITDNTTHDSGTLTFTGGSVSGTLSATTSTLTNFFAPSSNTLTLDGHKYTVTIPSAALASPTSPQNNILASVSVSNVTGPPAAAPQVVHPIFAPQAAPVVPPPTNNTPEPSSIILACAAIGAIGVRRLRLAMA